MANASLFLFLFLLPVLIISTAAVAETTPEHRGLVEQSCVHASYPDLCIRTLSTADAATPGELAQAAVRVSLAQALQASAFLSDLKPRGRTERGVLSDCVNQMADSLDELSRTLSALRRLRRGADFQWQMNNAETWASAALTNEDTCLDGFREVDGKVRSDVRRQIGNAARLTSNALYLINLLEQ